MSELGDLYKQIATRKRDKKARNLAYSTQALKDHGITFTSHNNDNQLIITVKGARKIDFFPSTGLWIIRKTQERDRGLATLLAYYKENYAPATTGTHPDPKCTESEVGQEVIQNHQSKGLDILEARVPEEGQGCQDEKPL